MVKAGIQDLGKIETSFLDSIHDLIQQNLETIYTNPFEIYVKHYMLFNLK